MPLIGNPYVVGDTTGNFKVLDDISSYTLSFNPANDVSLANDTITKNDHRFITGQRVTYTHGGGSVIGGLSSGTAYFIVKNDANTIKLATSYANALISSTINLTSVGSGIVHTINLAFDGINTKFRATYSDGLGARIINAVQLTISINGVVQRPYESATPASGYGIEHPNLIVFSIAPISSDVFWGNVIANNFPTYDITDNKVDNFTGNGSQTEFTLSKLVPNNESILVTIDGVTQYPSDNLDTRAYTVFDSILTFISAPANGAEIQVRHIGFVGAITSSVTGFYGRTGNVGLQTGDPLVGVGIQSGGTTIGTGITALNFIGAGNTFAVNGNTVSVSIAGGINGIGIQSGGTTIGTGITALNFVGTGNTFSTNGNTVSVSIAGGINGIGIQSGGTTIGTGITALNFIGAGNTFSTNGNTVSVSIAGGSGGSGVSSTGILTCRGIANSSIIMESIVMNDFYNQGTNYGMIGPIEVSIGATITVGAGVSYVVI